MSRPVAARPPRASAQKDLLFLELPTVAEAAQRLHESLAAESMPEAGEIISTVRQRYDDEFDQRLLKLGGQRNR